MMRALLLLFLAAISAASVQADQITLRSGEVVEGFFQSEDDTAIAFVKMNGESVSIPADQVLKMEFSESGVPGCFSSKDQETCEVVLASLNGDSLVIAEGKARRMVRHIPRQEIQSLKLKRIAPHHRLIPFLVLRKRADLELGDAKVLKGRVVSIENDTVTIEDFAGEKHEVKEADIHGAVVVVEDVPFRPFRAANLYPGYAQLTSGRPIFGGAMMFTFAALWTGVGVEYAQAVQQNKKANADFTVLLFNNTSYLESFTRHQNNQAYLAGAATLLYAYHWFDLYWHRESMQEISVVPYANPGVAVENRRRGSFGIALTVRY